MPAIRLRRPAPASSDPAAITESALDTSSSSSSTPKRPSGRVAAARMSRQQAAEARFPVGQDDYNNDNDNDDSGDDDDNEQGQEEDNNDGIAEAPEDAVRAGEGDDDDDNYKPTKKSCTPARTGRRSSHRALNASSIRSRGRPRRAPQTASLAPSDEDDEEDVNKTGVDVRHIQKVVDDMDNNDEGAEEEEQQQEVEEEENVEPPARRSVARKKPKAKTRGKPRASTTARNRKQYGEASDEGDDDEHGSLPPFKKRFSRTRGFRLVVDNGQTALQRFDSESEDEDPQGAKGRGRGRPKSRARAGRRPGRPPRRGLPAVRIIEDSEDEDSADDRPRPKGPPPYHEPSDVPPAEVFRAKIGGKIWVMESDELVLPDDPDGDTKIDKLGRCLGGRQWKPASFTSSLRVNPHKVYFLAVDAARACGFRDSLTFFRADTRLVRINLLQQEKDDLIATGRLHSQQRGRNVTFVGARNVFKIYGAKVVKNGRAVIDDYYESEAKAKLERTGKADTVGQLLPEEDHRSNEQRRRDADRERDRTRRPPDAITHVTTDPGGRLITTVFGDNGASPFMRSLNWPSRRMTQQRADLTEENWLIEMSRNVQGMNRELAENRLERLVKFRKWHESPDDGKVQRILEQQQQEDAEAVALATTNVDIVESHLSALDAQRAAAARTAATTKRDRAQDLHDHENSGPVGLYDPTTNLPHVALSTQPKKARIEKVSSRPLFSVEDELDAKLRSKPAVLGGKKIGSGAWGVASWRTDMALEGLRPEEASPWMSHVKRLPAATGWGDEA